MPVRHSIENVADGNARDNDNQCSLCNILVLQQDASILSTKIV